MRNSGTGDGQHIVCPQCGEYELTGPHVFEESRNWNFKPALSCATRQASDAGQLLRVTTENATGFSEGHSRTRANENVGKLLSLIARRSGRPGRAADIRPTIDFTLIDCYSVQEFAAYIGWVVDDRLVKAPPRSGLGQLMVPTHGDKSVQLSLTMSGWNQVQPLPQTGGIPGRCFVAMWFSEETRTAYENGIEPAVSDAGFKPIRIDKKEHNNEIPDEIIAEIRNCQFMVADFTGQRAGVYYEAGFAMGLGRSVIWCCRKDEIEKLHFDTNHKNHIDWQTPQELRERLYTRIRSTILDQA
ncbi:MAG: nucleoside 2-deoxyribosyltransferase [Acidobacteriia bacterium]|nr:nucleoside 2-deoxyribosyltransferase [Terriglobia bacterium]